VITGTGCASIQAMISVDPGTSLWEVMHRARVTITA